MPIVVPKPPQNRVQLDTSPAPVTDVQTKDVQALHEAGPVAKVEAELPPPPSDDQRQNLGEIGAKDRATARGAFARLFSIFTRRDTSVPTSVPSTVPTSTSSVPMSASLLPTEVTPTLTRPVETPKPAIAEPVVPTVAVAEPVLPTVAEPAIAEVIAHAAVETPLASVIAKVEVKKPGIEALYADPQFAALYAFTMTSLHKVEGEHSEWDRLGQVRSFGAAVDFVMKGRALDGSGAVDPVGNLFARFPGTQERRAVCHLLLLLMPPSDRSERPMLANGSRGVAQDLFRPFPGSVVARAADDFAMRPGDLPKINPIFTSHLTSPTFLDDVFKPGQQGLFLASKSHCPGAFVQDRKDINPATLDKKQQSGHQGDPIMVKIDEIIEVDGKKMAKVHVPAQHKVWLGDDGGCHQGAETLGRLDVVTGLDGKPVLDAAGKPKPILIPVDHLAKYMLAEGDGARGLDLNRAEDRCIALTYADTLKTTHFTDRNGYTKTLFDWLEQADHRTPREDVTSMRAMAREAAFQTVARYTSHPRRTHFKLEFDSAELAAVRSGKKKPEDADWQLQAFLRLEQTGICRDCGNYYEKDKASTADVHEMAWTAQFLEAGYVGGSLDCLGSSDAYDKLSKSFLEPLGVISTTGIAEGHGAVLVRVLGQPGDDGVIQAGVPMKVKPNELIIGLEMPISSGRGPAAQYMENWGGYLKIAGPIGASVDFTKSNERLAATMAALP